MQLSEEYLQRHALNVPIVKHIDYGVVFLREADSMGVDWSILQITHKPDPHHPATYNVTTLAPIHNGHERRSGSFETLMSQRLEWDQYEDFIVNWAKRQRLKPISDIKEIALTAWEMFVFSHDSTMARYASQDALFRSLDLDLSIDERFKGYQEITFYLNRQRPNYFDAWNKDMMNYIKRYAHWLVKLTDQISGTK